MGCSRKSFLKLWDVNQTTIHVLNSSDVRHALAVNIRVPPGQRAGTCRAELEKYPLHAPSRALGINDAGGGGGRCNDGTKRAPFKNQNEK